ncbi:MAG TPA: alpha/beta hydrolase [Candidatus Binatia bacterium]|jgi:predicted alpha/beta hydrolase family esterase|nr:alpha/beta hydrolase [Candidatus Binatia bacterium]
MKTAIILHGKPSKEEYYDPKAPSMSNAHWIPWLQGQLLKHDICAATPEVPNSFHPEWNLWCKEVERFDITPETIVVGHSAGAGFWLRWLSEHKDVKVAKVILVAVSLSYGWEEEGNAFFENFKLDPNLTSRTKLVIFNSDNDDPGIHQAVKEIRELMPAVEYKEFHNYGHFTIGSMKTVEFPELLSEILK